MLEQWRVEIGATFSRFFRAGVDLDAALTDRR
jgi:hypothetical protein